MGDSNKCCGVRFDLVRYGLHITVFFREYRIFICSFLLRLVCILLLWAFMYLLVWPEGCSPGGPLFDTTCTVMFTGIVGTVLSKLIRIPSLPCIVAAGVLYNSIPSPGYLTAGLTPRIYMVVGMFGLAVGMIRAGLSINLVMLRKNWHRYLAFSIIPMLSELILHAFVAKSMIGYPDLTWAMLHSSIVTSNAPSVIVPIIIELQRSGYISKDGPGMMILASVTLDTILAVWVIQLILAIRFNTMSLALAVGLGPLQVIGGILVGVPFGYLLFFVVFRILLLESERIALNVDGNMRMTERHFSNIRIMSFTVVLLLSLVVVALGSFFTVLGWSSITVVTMTAVFSHLCVKKGGVEHMEVRTDLMLAYRTFWDYISMPALFGFAGAACDVRDLFSPSSLSVNLSCISIGLLARFLLAVVVPWLLRMRFTFRELIFCGIAWIGKGPVQATFGSVPLALVQRQVNSTTTSAEKGTGDIGHAKSVQNCAVMTLLFACPLCSILAVLLGPKLLRREITVFDLPLVNETKKEEMGKDDAPAGGPTANSHGGGSTAQVARVCNRGFR
uniref:Putative sodium/hydrogen antiporter n=1 Tax=Trypanosoma vivax (strain Y486) TaxID=1055687 RepID=G0U9V3_TRYVY|nr:putative sodium/hydrogen antiporter [Trypanosoma vivax Y486]